MGNLKRRENMSGKEMQQKATMILIARRRELGLTQATLAKRMSTTASAIARLEGGGGSKEHSPSLRTIAVWSHALLMRPELTFLSIKE